MTDAAATPDPAPTPEPPSAKGDQRRNSAIRQISHSGFEALMSTLEAQGFEEMVRNLRSMGQVEAVMRKSPAMVGMLMALAWKFRDTPLLVEMFKNAEGAVVAAEDEPIAPCGRTFEDIRHAHLLGTARLFLTQRLPTPQADGKPVAKRGFFARLFGSKAVETSKADSAALYNSIKQYLNHQRQFELVPAYAMLPLRQISLIGGLLPALLSTEAIHVFAGLASGSAKLVVKVARQFAETVLAEANLTDEYLAATESFRVGLCAIDDAVAGYALNRLLTDYHDVIPTIVGDEDSAIEVVRRLAPKAGIDLWAIFRDPQRAVNVRFCPEAVAQALGHTSGLVHDAISSSFSSAKNPAALGLILVEIAKDLGEEAFISVINGIEHVKFWDGVVHNINRAETLDSGADLTLPKSSAALHSVTASALRDLQSIVRRPTPAKAA